MVICLLLLLRSLCLSEWQLAQRASIDLRGSRDPVPLSPFLPCQSFMNASGGKVAVREQQQTIYVWTNVGNSRAIGGRSLQACFFYYRVIKDASLYTRLMPGAKHAEEYSRQTCSVPFLRPQKSTFEHLSTSRRADLTFAGEDFTTWLFSPITSHLSDQCQWWLICSLTSRLMWCKHISIHSPINIQGMSFLVLSYFPCISCTLLTCRRQPIKY